MHRRSSRLCRDWRHPRRPAWLCAVLQSGVLSRPSAADPGGVGGWDVVSRRLRGNDDRCLYSRQASRHSGASPRRRRCAAVPIGIFLGRIANFIKPELWGRASDVAWAMVFPGGGPLPRHPSQLYEASLEGLVLFLILFVAVRLGALRRPGLVTGIFGLGYGTARIICEFFREPDPQLGFLFGGATMGMLLSLPLIAAGVFSFCARCAVRWPSHERS